MREREKIVAFGLLILLLVSWFGFLFHRSPRFAGSLTGGLLGIAGAFLMLLPLVYLFIKRIPVIRKSVTRHVSMSTLLTWHIYAGIAGPIFAILHTGHKFESLLGITLTSFMLLVVFSGFIGRYLLSFISQEMTDKKTLLHELEQKYHSAALELRGKPEVAAALFSFSGFFSRVIGSFLLRPADAAVSLPYRVVALSESIADVEYAIRTHSFFKRAFSIWLKFHIAISLILYGLLAAHIISGVYYGLRWFD